MQFEELQKDYIETFSTERGKRVLEDLKQRCFFKRALFSKEALEMARNEGQRMVYLHIETMLSLDINKLKEMKEKK